MVKLATTLQKMRREVIKLRKKSSKARQNVRKAYPHGSTDHAKLYVVRGKHQRYFFRVERCEPKKLIERTMRVYLAHHIFGMIFPKNAIKVKAMAEVTVKNEPEVGVLSEIIKGRSLAFKAYSNHFYERRTADPKLIHEHAEFVKSVGTTTASEINKYGINVNNLAMNVAEVKGNPVYFEVTSINPQKLEETLKRKHISKEKILKSIVIPDKYKSIANQWIGRFFSGKNVNIQIE